MREKRLAALLIPYRTVAGDIEVFLQKRGPDMERLPNNFGLWGGGIDPGETPEQAVIREAREELGIDLGAYRIRFLNKYEFWGAIEHCFIFEAPENFEDMLVIGEGEYGKWFSAEDAFALPNLIFQSKVIINDMQREIFKKPIR
jgi:8-oxo-dGTP pyrophosphatase MutT (NUDIX family)